MVVEPARATGFRDPRILLPFLLITLIWSSTWIVIKDQLGADPSQAVPPTWSVTYRFIIAGAAMFIYAAAIGARLKLNRGEHLLALAFGLPQFVLNFNFVYWAEHHVTSGLVAVVFALLMVPNSLFAWAFLGQKSTLRFAGGSAVACAGVALLFVQEIRASPGAAGAIALGIGLTLLGVLSASAANIIQAGQRAKAMPLASMIAWGMAYGALANAALALALYGAPQMEARPVYWLGVVYLGLFASALAFPLYFAVMRAVGPGKAAYSSLLVPILAMAISTVAEGYRWTSLAVAGGMLAMIGLFIALRSGRVAPPAPAD